MNSVTTPAATAEPKIGAWKGGWLLVKASWYTLNANKKLLWLPTFAAFLTTVTLALYLFVLWRLHLVNDFTSYGFHWATIGIFLLDLMISLIIGNFFTGAFIASVLRYYETGKTDMQYGLQEAKKKFSSLLQLSLASAMFGTLGQVAKLDKLPWWERVIAALANVSWQIVIVFAVPVIMASEKPLNIVETVKGSAQVLKKAWAEDVTGGLGMGLIFLVVTLVILWIMMTGVLLDFGLWATGIVWAGALLALALYALVAYLFIIMMTLSTIFHAALFHYAQTGEAPEKFTNDLMRAAFKPRKKWFK